MDTRNDPIEFSHEDQLGRASTAKVFARALLNDPKRPMIVAVFGPWGSGKTSFANLLSADLRSAGATCTWFNPWQFTNSDALTLAFFDLLATSLGRNKPAEMATTRECFFRYAEAVTSRVVSAGSQDKSGRFSRQPSGGAGLLDQPPIQDQRDLLIKLFGSSAKPIIVFIDDIDRLFAVDIRLLIQLVKSNADFPNLKFVLLFQKETIEAALKTEGQTGSEFLEKIIEVPIELPLIRGGKYVDDLLREVSEMFGDLAELAPRDNDRWQDLLQRGVLRHFTTLRQKNRLLDRLNLHKWNVETGLGIDLNLVDLVAFEILRSIDYELYAAVRHHGHLLTESGDVEPGAVLTELLSELKQGDHELGTVIVSELFPCLSARRAADFQREADRSFRICSARHFPKYFLEGVLPEEMTRAGRRRLEFAAKQGVGLFALLVTFHEHGLLLDGLSYLGAKVDEIPEARFVEVAADVARIVEDYGRSHGRNFRRSVAQEGFRVVAEILRRAPDRQRLAIFRAMVGSDEFAQLPALLLAVIGSSVDWFDARAAAGLEAKMARSIAKAAGDGRLEQYEEFGPILRYWNRLAGPKAKSFVRDLARHPQRFIHFARAVTPQIQTAGGISQVSTTTQAVSGDAILDFMPRPTAIRSAKAALETAGARHSSFVLLLLAALEAQEKSRTESGSAVAHVPDSATETPDESGYRWRTEASEVFGRD